MRDYVSIFVETTFAIALIITDICGILAYLKDLQNKFLEETMEIAANNTCPSLLHIQTGEESSGMRERRMNELQESEVIKYEWNDDILNYSQANLEYGKGKEIIFHFSKIELELARSLVSGKVIIDMEQMEGFEYHLELFHGFSTILEDIRAKIPQEKLTSPIKNDSLVEASASAILAELGFVMTYLKKTGANPTHTIANYCLQLDPNTTSHLTSPPIADIQIRHLIDLYEEVEDIIAAKIALVDLYAGSDHLYTTTIPAEVKGELDVFSKKIPLPAFITALRRFIFRYLSVEKIKPNHPLMHYLAALFLCWPHDIPKDEDKIESEFPSSLLVCHSCKAYTMLLGR
jgi:hypothetical protein